jgi:hypothetical protein
MKRASLAMCWSACVVLGLGCSGGSDDDDSDAGKAPPAKVCEFGADQTCNDNPIISSLHGVCHKDGTCECHLGFAKTEKGLCR